MHTNFTVQTTYTQDAIRMMTKMAYDLFLPQLSGRMYLLSFALLIFGGIGYAMNPVFATMLAMGCFTLTSAEYASKAAAKRMITSFKNDFPVLKFDFRSDSIYVVTPQDSGTVRYSILTRLAESRDYFFLFNSPQSAYVIDKNGFTNGNADEFKTFIQSKTNLTFEHGATLKQKIVAAIQKK